MPSLLASRVINLLSPSVGDFIAKAKVRAACKMAKLDIETLDTSQLPQFLEKFELVCASSFGSETTKNIKGRILTY